jgi:hypothetical protein
MNDTRSFDILSHSFHANALLFGEVYEDEVLSIVNVGSVEVESAAAGVQFGSGQETVSK